jgi:type III restriction enzyme
MSVRVIDNPIINSPYDPPAWHFAFDNQGITDRVIESRRPSSYFVSAPRPRKRGVGQQLEFAELTADQIEKNDFVKQTEAQPAGVGDAGSCGDHRSVAHCFAQMESDYLAHQVADGVAMAGRLDG